MAAVYSISHLSAPYQGIPDDALGWTKQEERGHILHVAKVVGVDKNNFPNKPNPSELAGKYTRTVPNLKNKNKKRKQKIRIGTGCF